MDHQSIYRTGFLRLQVLRATVYASRYQGWHQENADEYFGIKNHLTAILNISRSIPVHCGAVANAFLSSFPTRRKSSFHEKGVTARKDNLMTEWLITYLCLTQCWTCWMPSRGSACNLLDFPCATAHGDLSGCRAFRKKTINKGLIGDLLGALHL